MSKKVWKIICIVSAVVLLIVIGIFAIKILSISQQPNVSMIGGAGMPTFVFVTHTLLFRSPLFIVGILALILFVVSGIGLIYQRFIQKR